MKKLLFLTMCLFLARHTWSQAQDNIAQAAALAAQRDAEERYKRLDAEVRNLMEAQEGIQRRQDEFRQRLDKLAEEIRSLKEDQSRTSANMVTREELRKYVDKLKEVDEKRESDKKVILDNIKELAKLPNSIPPEPKTAPRRSSETSGDKDSPCIYVVQKNDRLLDIVAAYNDEFQKEGRGKVTVDEILKANPSIKANLVRTGQKLRIPVPAKESK